MNSKDFREKFKKVEPKTGLDFSRQFYQTKEWRTIRENYRKKKRKEHEAIVFKVYEENVDKNKPSDLMAFMYDERKNPLDETELKNGIIKVADVADHILSRRYGGSDDKDNLQWLTKENHYKKTKKESRQQYDV